MICMKRFRTLSRACIAAILTQFFVPGDLPAQQAELPLTGALEFANFETTCDGAISLPEPTGHHQVGTVTYHWVDRARPDVVTPDPHDDRQVIATLFYPALRNPDGPPAPYVPELDLLRAGFATDRREFPRQIAEDISVRACVLTHAFAKRPIDGMTPRYPIALVSPGGNVSRRSHTALAQELASHGWVAAVMSHLHSGLDMFPEGGFVMSADYWDAPEGASDAERARLEEELTSTLGADARFTLDRLAALGRNDPSGRFTGRLDTTRVAIVGHSRGGSTVARACASDDRFDACVIFDNIGPSPETETGLRQPQLTIRRPWSAEREKRLHAFLNRNAMFAIDAVVDGAAHMSFTDLPLVEPGRHETAIRPERAHAITAALTLAFIERHVLGRGSAELPAFAEVGLTSFGDATGGDAIGARSSDGSSSRPLPRRDPGDIGISQARLAEAHALADSLGTAAYLLVVDGAVVDSYGDVAHEYRLHSVRKSLLGLLYGVAVEAGRIDTSLAVGALGMDDFAGLTPREKSATLVDLMGSRSGIYLPATHENERWDDVRPARGSFAPGTHWFYSNWDFNTAGTAYQLLTGENLFAAFQLDIADPIGMEDFDASDGAWRYGPRSWHPAYVFRMSTRDLARLGILAANEGRWDGRQVVPADWVLATTSRRSSATRPDGTAMPGVGYGLMWWTRDLAATRDVYGELGEDVFVASGTGQQILLVAPDRNLVFVHRTDTDVPEDSFRSVSDREAGRIVRILLGGRPGQ